MRIKEDLPQFKEAHSLLLVTGDQSGLIYYAYKGEIEKIAEFKETPVYQKKEGFFERRVRQGFGRMTSRGSTSPEEKNEDKAQTAFLKEFSQKVKHETNVRNVSEIYLFSPSYFERTLFEALDTEIQKKIVLGVHGTFTKEHPFTVLMKIKEAYVTEEPAVEPSKEAKKLLTKNGEAYAPSALSHARVERVKAFMARKKK